MLRDAALWLRPAGWPPLAAAVRRRALLLAWATILAQVVFLGGSILAGALQPHYSAIRQYISELGRDGAEERLWAFVAQAWALVCATVLLLEATLTPGRLHAHEAYIPRGAPAEPAAVGIDPA